MKFAFPSLAACPLVFRCFGPAAARNSSSDSAAENDRGEARGGGDMVGLMVNALVNLILERAESSVTISFGDDSDSTPTDESSTTSQGEPDTTDSGPATREKRLRTTEELRSGLEDKKRSILAMIDDVNFRFDYFSMVKYVRDLQKEFFDALRNSKMYPHYFFDKKTRDKLLAMPPESFRENFRKAYESDENIVRSRKYRNKVEEHAARERELASQIEREVERTAGPSGSLKALEGLLEECKRKRRTYSTRLASGLENRCRHIQKHYAIVNNLPLERILGENAVQALYESYLVDKRDLREHGPEEDRGSSSEEETASSTHGEQCDECIICTDPLRPSEHMIECEGHRFHGACLYAWSRKEMTCPLCRRGFTPEQREALEEGKRMHAVRRIRSMSRLRDDPALEKKYLRDGEAIRKGGICDLVLKAVYRKIKLGFLRLSSHPHYPEIFSNREDYPELYIPQNIADYFAGDHDPRSKGFYAHRAAMVRCMQSYLDIRKTRGSLMCRDISRLFCTLLDLFCAGDCSVEIKCTVLGDADSTVDKALVVERNPGVYPVIYSLTRERVRFCVRCDNDIYGKIDDAINKGGVLCACDRELWLENF